jgi:hypothetical protein
MRFVAPALVSNFASQPEHLQAAWIADCAEAIWATAIGILSLGLLLSSNSWTHALQVGERSIVPFLLVCICTGLWASQLASLVHLRLYETRPLGVVHATLLLAIFSAAAFKQEHTGLLAMTLPALLCAAPSLVRCHAAHSLHTRVSCLASSTVVAVCQCSTDSVAVTVCLGAVHKRLSA